MKYFIYKRTYEKLFLQTPMKYLIENTYMEHLIYKHAYEISYLQTRI